MGTGIVGVAAATVPMQLPGLHAFGAATWLLASLLLVVLTGAWAVQWVRHTERATGHARDPVRAQFWGAVAMGVMTVGTGALKFGAPVIGEGGAIGTAWVLWAVGSALGVVTAVWIPYMMIVHHDVERDSATAIRLMPVVPPMVSA